MEHDNADGYLLDVYSGMGASDCRHRDTDLVCCANPALRETTEGLMVSTLPRSAQSEKQRNAAASDSLQEASMIPPRRICLRMIWF